MYKFNLLVLKKVFSFYFKRFYFAIFLFFICFAVMDLYLKNRFINKNYLKEIEIKFEFDKANKSIADYAAFYNFKIYLKQMNFLPYNNEKAINDYSEITDNSLKISEEIILKFKREILSHIESFARVKFLEPSININDDVFNLITLAGSELNINEDASDFLQKSLNPILENLVRDLKDDISNKRFFSSDTINLLIYLSKDTAIMSELKKSLTMHEEIFYKSFAASEFFLKSDNFFSIKLSNKSLAPGNYWVIVLASFLFMNIFYLFIIYIYYFLRTSEKKII